MIHATGLTRTYHRGRTEVRALRGVDLRVEAGQFVALRGRSGSGKTTLLNLLSGLDRPDAGTVLLEGRDLASLKDAQMTDLRRRRFGFVFQSFALLPVFSAYENVELALRLAGMGLIDRRRRAREVLESVGLEAKADHRPFELSGGEQQRLAIARALANRPALILADEPTGELDSNTGLSIMRLFRSISAREGVTVIMATHDPTASLVVDVTYHLVDGRIQPIDSASVRSLDGVDGVL